MSQTIHIPRLSRAIILALFMLMLAVPNMIKSNCCPVDVIGYNRLSFQWTGAQFVKVIDDQPLLPAAIQGEIADDYSNARSGVRQ